MKSYISISSVLGLKKLATERAQPRPALRGVGCNDLLYASERMIANPGLACYQASLS
jgi:hypothetical protein